MCEKIIIFFDQLWLEFDNLILKIKQLFIKEF